MTNLTIFGEADEDTIKQMEICLAAEEDSIGVLCADSHLGYSQPIGGAVAYREHISPSGVGYDIGCGNKAVKTSLMYQDIREDIASIMDEIYRRIDFGMGGNNPEKVTDHPVYDLIRNSEVNRQRKMIQLAQNQLGTVGSGNHYVDLFKDETGRIWIGVHFGSRGFGHKTASGFLALADGKEWGDKVNDSMFASPKLFHVDSELGYLYIHGMGVAGAYAYAGRDIVCDKVLEILGAESMHEVHNHHNFAWLEEHGGENFFVIRKGCTPAFPGQEGFVGASMGEQSVILEGAEDADDDALFSTVHGAGRVMSRTEAKGKTKKRKRWECNDRDCDYFHTDIGQFSCPDHPDSKPMKRWHEEIKSEGKINWFDVKEELKKRKIEIRGGAADEAPGAYKRLNEVLDHHLETINITHTLTPIGVAMA